MFRYSGPPGHTGARFVKGPVVANLVQVSALERLLRPGTRVIGLATRALVLAASQERGSP